MRKLFIIYAKKTPIHLLFWCLVWVFFYLFFSSGSQNNSFLFWFSSSMAAITIVSSYVFTLKLIPEYLLKQKYWLFALYTIYSFIFTLFGVILTILLGFVFFFHLEYQQMPALIKSPSVISICVLLIITLVSGFQILLHNYKAVDEKQHLKNKFLETQLELKEQELKFLKMQIHPHFLFNTLNTLYGFAIKKGDEAPEIILKLSNLLDYILYQVDKPFVALHDEVHHIEDYLSLEKIRFQNSIAISFIKNIYKENQEIPPMLLLPFIENACKHGNPIAGVLRITIDLLTNEEKLTFVVSNTTKNMQKTKGGIGLENIKRRLDMLYPDQYTIETTLDNNWFTAKLNIPLRYA